MNEKNLKCKDCKVELENGCMMDYTRGAVFVGRYAQVDAIPTGKLKRVFGAAEAKFKSTRRIHAFRCPNCNSITLVAQDQIDSDDLVSDINSRVGAILIIALAFILVFAVIIGVGASLGIL